MKNLVIIVLLTFISIQINAQPSHREDAYIEFIKKFYYHLLEDDTVTVRECTELLGLSSLEAEIYLFNFNCDRNPDKEQCKERGVNSLANEWGSYSSMVFQKLRKIESRFMIDTYEGMDSIIRDCGNFYDEGKVSSIAFDIRFFNGKAIYFYLNRYPDEPITILNIYFEDGSSIYNYLHEGAEGVSKNYLQRLAIINDPDGYTNVRKDKGSEYPIVGKIAANEVFIFTPNYYEDWWKVRNKDGSVEGYMHKSRIVPFGNLPEEKKKELKDRN